MEWLLIIAVLAAIVGTVVYFRGKRPGAGGGSGAGRNTGADKV